MVSEESRAKNCPPPEGPKRGPPMNVPRILPGALRVSGVIELATGCVLIAAPSVVIQALSGSPSDQAGWIVGRVLGGALLALGVVAMVPGSSADRGVTLALGVYNTSTTVILVAAGANGRADGSLLWPAAAVHATLGAALIVGRIARPRPREELV
jgi:hypothetical protein